MDVRDILKPKGELVFNGRYYERANTAPQYFKFKSVSHPSASYGEIINNLIITQQAVVISTTLNLDYKVGAYISTNNGSLWEIEQVQKDCKNSIVSRLMATNPGCEYIIAMHEIDNPRNL